ncbi:MAG: hypothetical protein MK447_00020 [SAR324 cluster bacterium]|nr:hypothetical protein [SAR324 cluster bacterium]
MRNSFAPPSSAPRLQLDLLRTTVLKHGSPDCSGDGGGGIDFPKGSGPPG